MFKIKGCEMVERKVVAIAFLFALHCIGSFLTPRMFSKACGLSSPLRDD